MKKIISLILSVIFIISLCACTAPVVQESTESSQITEKTEITSTDIQTDGQTSEPDITTEEPDDSNVVKFDVFDFVKNHIDVDVSAKCAMIVDADTNEILYINCTPETRLYPASTTKLLTALVALEYCDPDVIIQPGEEYAFPKPGSTNAYIRPRHKLSLDMLIEGMMLPSGGDAAFVIAAYAGRVIAHDESLSAEDAVSAFVDEMNRYGKEELGLKDTHFTCPDGDHDDDHYTTLADIMTIARYAMDEPVITKHAKKSYEKVTYASGHQIEWKNTNSLIDKDSKYYYEYANGLKTGTTDEAGCCLISTAEKDGHRVLCGVFGASQDGRYIDSLTLLKAAFEVLE